MPPKVSTSPVCHTPQIHPPTLPRSTLNSTESHKHRQLRRMEITVTSKRFIHILVLILALMSIFRLLRFVITTYSPSPRLGWADFVRPCNFSESSCKEVASHTWASSSYPNSKPITKKEYRFLSSIITQKTPCNLLIFGWEPQYRRLAKINAAGTTVILEDTPNSGSLEISSCKLALTNLPNEVYKNQWDVILVDGPSSDGPEAPARMTAIYTSSMIARARNSTTNVVIHDIHRTIEKWFSREFLCEENLVSSKGRYWNFKIKGGEQWQSGSFCSQGS